METNESKDSSWIKALLWRWLGFKNRTQFLKVYLASIRKARSLTLFLMMGLMFSSLIFAGISLLLLAFFLSPLSQEVKMWTALGGGAAILIGITITLALLFRQSFWLSLFKVDKMITTEVKKHQKTNI